HTLDYAMRRLAADPGRLLPVVSRTDARDLQAVVSLADVVAAYRIGERPALQPGAARSSRRLLVRVSAAFIAAAMLTAFLNYFFRAERAGRAGRDYQAGLELMQRERYDEAVTEFRDALSISHSPVHRLALGLALVQAGRVSEAALYLNEVLR